MPIPATNLQAHMSASPPVYTFEMGDMPNLYQPYSSNYNTSVPSNLYGSFNDIPCLRAQENGYLILLISKGDWILEYDLDEPNEDIWPGRYGFNPFQVQTLERYIPGEVSHPHPDLAYRISLHYNTAEWYYCVYNKGRSSNNMAHQNLLQIPLIIINNWNIITLNCRVAASGITNEYNGYGVYKPSQSGTLKSDKAKVS